MASGTGMTASRTPTRIMPPAMPKMPDSSDVPTIVKHRTEISSGLMAGFSRCLNDPDGRDRQTELSRAQAQLLLSCAS